MLILLGTETKSINSMPISVSNVGISIVRIVIMSVDGQVMWHELPDKFI